MMEEMLFGFLFLFKCINIIITLLNYDILFLILLNFLNDRYFLAHSPAPEQSQIKALKLHL
jgi:hypothetical protein